MPEFTVLGSGSSGNAVAIKSGNEVILVDAGFSAVELERRLAKANINLEQLCGILITHEHNDHSQAVKTFSKRYNLPVYSNHLTAERLKYMKKLPDKMSLFSNGSKFNIGTFQIEAFSISHDAADPVGFIVNVESKKIGLATDLGHAGKMVPLKLSCSDLLMIESNHDPMMVRKSARPLRIQQRILGRRGHLCNEKAAELMADAIGFQTSHVVLVHLSSDCNELKIVEETFQKKLKEIGREDITIEISVQDHVSQTITL